MLVFAHVRYGIAPEVFWRLSLWEWGALTRNTELGDAPLGRNELERLLAEFPDG